MSDEKHTAGLRQAKPIGDGHWVVMCGDIVTARFCRNDHVEWNEAEAQLLAQAPAVLKQRDDLQAALLRLLWLVEIEHHIDGKHITRNAHAALANAEPNLAPENQPPADECPCCQNPCPVCQGGSTPLDIQVSFPADTLRNLGIAMSRAAAIQAVGGLKGDES